MTKPLPQRDVEARATRGGRPRLTAIEEKLLASVHDKNLKKVIAELLISSRGSQENFQKLEQWFPVQPSDFHGVSGIPFREVVWCEVNGEKGKIERGGVGMVVQRLAKGVYRVLVEEGVDFDSPPDFVTVVPRTSELFSEVQAVAADADPITVKGIGSGWEVRLFSNVASSTPIDSFFYLLGGNFVDSAGETIVGPRGPAGPTHKSLWNGAGPPPAELGGVDDFYVDTEAFLFYGPKTEAGWGGGVSLQGPQGEQGEKGEKGEEGPGGQSGFRYNYLSNAENTDPGAGNLKFNAAVGAATVLRISETDHDGNALAAFLATIDDSTNPTHGTIILRKEKVPSVFAIFQVTGTLTDNGTWDSIGVTHVASSGLANGDEVVLQYYRAGDKGPSKLLESEDVIEWKQESVTLREKIRGFYDGVNRILELVAGEGEAETLISKLRIYGGGSKILARIAATVGATTKTVLDGEGRSSFLQLSAVSKITDFGLVEALPASPAKGDRCKYIADKTNGAIWNLVYDGEGTLPWKKVGGPRLMAASNIERLLENKTAYTSLPTDPLKITLPLKGDYDITIEARARSVAATRFGLLSYALGAFAAADEWSVQLYAGNTDISLDMSKTTRWTGLAAAIVIEEKGKTGGAYLFQWLNRRLWVDPVRVG